MARDLFGTYSLDCSAGEPSSADKPVIVLRKDKKEAGTQKAAEKLKIAVCRKTAVFFVFADISVWREKTAKKT